jgi:hypothetical protein
MQKRPNKGQHESTTHLSSTCAQAKGRTAPINAKETNMNPKEAQHRGKRDLLTPAYLRPGQGKDSTEDHFFFMQVFHSFNHLREFFF